MNSNNQIGDFRFKMFNFSVILTLLRPKISWIQKPIKQKNLIKINNGILQVFYCVKWSLFLQSTFDRVFRSKRKIRGKENRTKLRQTASSHSRFREGNSAKTLFQTHCVTDENNSSFWICLVAEARKSLSNNH